MVKVDVYVDWCIIWRYDSRRCSIYGSYVERGSERSEGYS